MSLRVLSLGAGVQSSTLLLMAEAGDLPRPDVALFADTGWEPQAVYRWLDFLRTATSIPIETVSVGNLRADTLAGRLPSSSATSEGRRFATMPFHLRTQTLEHGMLRRQCTNEYKLRPLRRRIRELLRGGPADLWIGISCDEAHRMRPSGVRYCVNVYPLIEAGMRRADCLRWLTAHGYPTPPKSSCVGCPFHDDHYWRRLREESPAEFADACAFDAATRSLPRIRGEVYLHRSLRPLAEAIEDGGQQALSDMFGEECTGLCGV